MNVRILATAVAIAAVSAFGFATQSVAAPNLVTNGGFEDGNFNAGGGYKLGLTDADVPGWHLPASDGTYPWGLQNGNAFGAGPADTGVQWLVLGEWGPNTEFTIQQTVTGLTPGAKYTMTWAGASELGCCAQGELSFLSGSADAAFGFTAPNSGSFWTQWSHFSDTFTANATSVTFQFKDIAPTTNGYDLGLDSVIMTGVTGVPEPATWAMTILGFGLLGAAVRRRRQQDAHAAA